MAKQVVINSVLLDKQNGQIKLLVISSIQPMMNDKIKSDVEVALSDFYQGQYAVNLTFSDDIEAETPSQYQHRMDNEARDQFIDTLNNSDFGITMKKNFNAVLLEHSVKKIEH